MSMGPQPQPHQRMNKARTMSNRQPPPNQNPQQHHIPPPSQQARPPPSQQARVPERQPIPPKKEGSGMANEAKKVWNERLLMHEKTAPPNHPWAPPTNAGGQDLLQMMYNQATPKIYPRLFPDEEKFQISDFNSSDPLSIFEDHMLHDGGVYKYVSSDEERAEEQLYRHAPPP